jgi:hypothetical protein
LLGVLLVQKAANSRLKVTNQALADARQSISDQLHTSRTRQAELTFKTGLELAGTRRRGPGADVDDRILAASIRPRQWMTEQPPGRAT